MKLIITARGDDDRVEFYAELENGHSLGFVGEARKDDILGIANVLMEWGRVFWRAQAYADAMQDVGGYKPGRHVELTKSAREALREFEDRVPTRIAEEREC